MFRNVYFTDEKFKIGKAEYKTIEEAKEAEYSGILLNTIEASKIKRQSTNTSQEITFNGFNIIIT